MRGRTAALVLVLVVALGVRLFVVSLSPPLYDDAQDYQRIAVAISKTGNFPPTIVARPGSASAFRPPAYPAALGAVYAIAGDAPRNGRLLGALLGTAAVAFIFLIGQRLWDRRTGLVAAGLTAVYPPLVFVNASVLSEALFIPVSLAAVWAVLKYRDEPQTRYALAAGLLGGIAALTKTIGIPLVLLLAATVLVGRRAPVRPRLGAAAALVVAAVLVVAPWTIRNANEFHALVPVSTEGGLTLTGTFNDQARTGPLQAVWLPPSGLPEFKRAFRSHLDEAQQDHRFRKSSLQFMRAHGGYVAKVAAYSLVRSFDLGPNHAGVTNTSYGEGGILGRWRRPVTLSTWALYAALLAAAAVMVAGRRVPSSPWVFLAVVALVLFVPSLLLGGQERYRLIADPFVLLLVVGALTPFRSAGGSVSGASRSA